jgi:hypothetical protein
VVGADAAARGYNGYNTSLLQLPPLLLPLLLLPSVFAAPRALSSKTGEVRHGAEPDRQRPATRQIVSGVQPGDWAPAGAATGQQLLARGHQRVLRPRDTVQPLATALGMSIDLSVDKEDPAAFAAAVQRKLTCNGTLLVAWQHQDVPALVQALAPPNAADYADWPLQCSGPYWPEPPYVKKTSACYVRATHTHSHRARSESVLSDAAFSLTSSDVVGRCVWLVDRIAFG